ncbi:hypothetical protein PLICRDRAFT_102389 [Plicaturopsis crispa FD-325 SS-3]|nr:hypothetical protein PLICRDRAFT_102389 [Plicaturopsis crispa FD-325 SS-3]
MDIDQDTEIDWPELFVHNETGDSPLSESESSDSGSDTDFSGSEDDSSDLDYDPNAMDVLTEAGLREGAMMAFKVNKVLLEIDAQGLDLPIFLDALSWGDPGCTSGREANIRYARSSLMHSTELPGILERWWKPPRSSKTKKRRPEGGKKSMEEFAASCVESMLQSEMAAVASPLKSPAGEDLTEETLTSISFSALGTEMKTRAPNLWRMLRGSAYSAAQAKRNTTKNPDKVSKLKPHANIVLMIVAMLAYTRNHHHSRIQKMFAVYLKFRGLSAKAFDTLHALGVTMSHKWTSNAVATMSENAMNEVVSMIQKYPFFISHDNINIPFRVFSQRLDNKSEFGNGTAATVYVKRNAQPLPVDANMNLQEIRAEGLKKPLEIAEIVEMDVESAPRIRDRMCYQVLRFILDSPEFDLKTYEQKDHDDLKPPPPVKGLPSGPEHLTLQYMLGTLNIPEASYDDNDRLLMEWLKQLKKNAPDEKRKLAIEQLIVWVGDQLTIDRLRGLFKSRAEDMNSYDRLDWLVPAFGWLHLEMAVETSLHKQYLGTASGRGLSHDFAVLERKGLASVLTKGPFHHNIQEALYHIAEAHLRIDICTTASIPDITALRKKSPRELLDLAIKVVSDHASTEAMDKIDHGTPAEKRDEVKRQTIMFNRDVLQYIVLDQAIKHGDIGIMEDSLPQLLFRFQGSGQSNYATEILELLQNLRREWPAELRRYVTENCWLVNFTGRPDGFLPVDMAQEHNIKDIKGPNINWEYLKKMHPAVRIIRALSRHMEEDFGTLNRGNKHGVPRKDRDVRKLQESYLASHTHDLERNGRKIKSADNRAPDVVTLGCTSLQTGSKMRDWVSGRQFKRSMQQRWPEEE